MSLYSGPPQDDDTHEVNPYDPNLVNSSTQTVIRVYPFVIEGVTHFADVKSDKKNQTTLSVRHDLESNKFYTLLRYTPFQDIKEDSLRVIEIPRFRKLNFITLAMPDNLDETIKKFTLEDDDGVGYLCSEVLRRAEGKITKSYKDAEVQTEVRAVPHLLEPAAVATVITDSQVQTMTCCRRKSF